MLWFKHERLDAAAPASSLEYVNAEDTQSATQKSTTDHAEYWLMNHVDLGNLLL